MAPQPTTRTTSVPANSFAQVPSQGFVIQLLPSQAFKIRRYLSTVIDAVVGGGAHLWAIGGMAQFQRQPFSNANAFVGYPLVEPSIGGTGVAPASPFGLSLTNVGVTFTLLDDWFEFDDTFTPFPVSIQVQSIWEIGNSTAGALNCIAGEELTYDLYDGTLALA